MSQQGFPNGGILPDNTDDFTYSDLIFSEAQIKAAAEEYLAEAYNPTVFDHLVTDTVSSTISGLLTAGAVLAQFYIQQVTYQGEDGYGTVNNPVEPGWSQEVKESFTRSLGPDPDKNQLYSAYEYSSSSIDGVNNTFFNLGLGPDAFAWDENGNLTITDTYVFTGLDDIGAAPTYEQKRSLGGMLVYFTKLLAGVIVGVPLVPLAFLKGNNILSKLLFHLGNPEDDPTIPFNLSRYIEIYGENATVIGEIEPMTIRTTFTPQELYDYNRELFWNAVKAGLIPFSALVNMENFVCNSLTVGSGPNAFLPNYGSVASDIGSNPNNWTLGGGGNYPRPFTSFSQRIVEATYSLGPFAKFGSISGRIGNLSLLCEDTDVTDLGFIRQDWYNADIGNSLYADNNEPYKYQWWDQANKTKIRLPYGHLPGHPELEIEVATASYLDNSQNKYSVDLPVQNDYTLLLGAVLLAATLRI